MFEFNRKKTYKKFIYSPLALLLLFLILLVFIRAVFDVYKKERVSDQYLKKEQEQLASMTSRQKELSQSVDYLKTDKGVEVELRSKFRVVREGESVAVIVDNDASSSRISPIKTAPIVTSIVATTTQKNLWQRLLDAIGF